jgi:hypothetical protein
VVGLVGCGDGGRSGRHNDGAVSMREDCLRLTLDAMEVFVDLVTVDAQDVIGLMAECTG